MITTLDYMCAILCTHLQTLYESDDLGAENGGRCERCGSSCLVDAIENVEPLTGNVWVYLKLLPSPI